MIVALAVALAFAVINALRGKGWLGINGHIAAPILWAITAGLGDAALRDKLAEALVVGGVTGVGMFFWCVWGWGLYFASFSWRWNSGETEIRWIDWVSLHLIPMRTDEMDVTNGIRGTIAMALRGLYITPFFFMLGHVGLGIAVGLLQGIVYASARWVSPTKPTEYAEPLYGLVIGSAVAYILKGGF